MIIRTVLAATFVVTFSASSFATGLMKCESGDPSEWMSQEALKAQLVAQGYEVRRVKVDDGCYEAYVIDADGNMSEMYYNPVDLAFIAVDD